MKLKLSGTIIPKKGTEKISIKNIVADNKIFKKGVERYKEKIIKGEPIKPITVIKHPSKDLYAVLDGHHRFYAFLESGIDTIECSVIKAPSLLFDGTIKGWLQPPAHFTRFVRIPMKEFTKYINGFVKNPQKLLKQSTKITTDLHPIKFNFEESFPTNIRNDVVNWFNLSAKKMKLEKEISEIYLKTDKALDRINVDYEKSGKKATVVFGEKFLNNLNENNIFHVMGHLHDAIRSGLKFTERIRRRPKIVRETASEIVNISIDGRLEKKNLPHISKEARKTVLQERFLKKLKIKVDRNSINKIVNKFWGKKVKSEKEAIKKAEEVVQSIEEKKS